MHGATSFKWDFAEPRCAAVDAWNLWKVAERDQDGSAVQGRFFMRRRSDSLLLLLDAQTARDAVHLVSGLDRSHLCDLCRGGDLGIDVGLSAREPSQRALRGGVFDASLLHQPRH